MADGILLLDKPLGLSSNAALQRVRRRFGRIKAGHTGSLDPLASGMLPICLGEATKLAGYLLSERKCYLFTVQLGEARSTGDAEGEVTRRCEVPVLTREQLQPVLAGLHGPQQQVPPMYSALKHQGQPLYRLARRGVEVERAPRTIEIHSLELLQIEESRLTLRLVCSKGTYVRTLSEQLAALLGSCGYVSLLRREYVEPFAGQALVTLDQLESETELPALLPADAALPQVPRLMLSAQTSRSLQQGQPIVANTTLPVGLVRLYDGAGRFFGLGELDAGGLVRARRLFAI